MTDNTMIALIVFAFAAYYLGGSFLESYERISMAKAGLQQCVVQLHPTSNSHIVWMKDCPANIHATSTKDDNEIQ
jgi:hypothetical protein